MTKMSNIIANLLIFIKYLKVKIKCYFKTTAISQIPKWHILSPKLTIKRMQKLQKPGQTPGLSH